MARYSIDNPWLEKAVESCLENISSNIYEDAHTILTAFCLLERLPHTLEWRAYVTLKNLMILNSYKRYKLTI